MQLLSFLTSVLHAGEFLAPALYPQRKSPIAHPIRSWVEIGAGLDALEKR